MVNSFYQYFFFLLKYFLLEFKFLYPISFILILMLGIITRSSENFSFCILFASGFVTNLQIKQFLKYKQTPKIHFNILKPLQLRQ